MHKPKLTNLRQDPLARLSAVIGLMVSLFLTQNAYAQSCNCVGGSLLVGIQISPSVAHIGDTVAISQLGVAVGAVGTTGGCLATNGIAYIMYPNGNSNCAFNTVYPSCPTAGNGINGVQIFENHFYITNAPNSSAPCAGPDSVQCIPSVIGDAGCVSFTATYVIQPSDTNKTLTFIDPNPRPDGLSGGNLGFLLPAIPRAVQFIAACDAYRLDNGQPEGGYGAALVNIITPGIAASTQFATNCAPYGQPVPFTGWVTNTGDTTLTNIVVTEIGVGTITYTNWTTCKRLPFSPPPNNALQPGDCVQYFGVFQLASNLCGPFQDTVTACGTDGAEVSSFAPGVTNFASKTVCATNSATSSVCSAPGLSVTKHYIGLPGASQQFDGAVCNTGNIPLINVSVLNDRILTGGTNLVASFPVLTNGECRKFYATELVSADTNSEGITATGTDPCGSGLSERVLTGSRDIGPAGMTIFDSRLEGTNFTLSFSTETNVGYTVQQSESLLPTDWQTLVEIIGDGTVATVLDPMTNSQRFYRVWAH